MNVTSIPDYLHSELLVLDRRECLRRLAAESFGRVVVSMPRQPLIRPVNYVFDPGSQSVVFRTAPGTKLFALRHASDAIFEIDGVDTASGTGWSVIIEGVTEEVTGEAELSRLAGIGVRTLAPGDRPHWIRIRAFTVSGREIAESTGISACV
jgi:nitroimidazol reductase NimA-like FMN-containing flavoprotein (pyridoxamine 5'-phosphate oxidase superfamily)